MVLEVQEKTSELRSFDSISSRGFLLYKQPYQESDLIVDMILERGLRISALVRGGQKSIKRFGGRLEALQLLHFQLRAPRGAVSYESLFSLESIEVVELLTGYRSSWQSLNEGLFYIEMFRDLFLKGELEAWVYPTVAKTLTLGNEFSLDKELSSWRKIYVWCFFANRLGFGVLGEKGLFHQLLGEEFDAWKIALEGELFSEVAVRLLERVHEHVLDKKILRDLYSDWIQRSHLKCRSLESLLV